MYAVIYERALKISHFQCLVIYERPHTKINLLFQGQALQFVSGFGRILIFGLIKKRRALAGKCSN